MVVISGSSDPSLTSQKDSGAAKKFTVGPAMMPDQVELNPIDLINVMNRIGTKGGAMSGHIPGTNPAEDYGVYVPSKIGFWENPQRVARYYNAFRAGDMDQTPAWLDRESIDTAYKYLEFRNQGKPWYRWDPLAEDDPGTAYLRSLASPPAEVLPDWEQNDAEWSLKDQQQQQQGAYNPPAVAPGTDATFGVQDAEWDKLPWWQKVIIPVMSSGPKFGAVLGGTLGVAGGPAGVAAGVAAGTALGKAGEAAQNNPNAPLSRLFTWATNAEPDQGAGFASGLLDWGAEVPERLFGLATQLGYAIADPERYGTVGEIIGNLPQAWQAATMFYTAMPSGGPGQQVGYLGASLFGVGREDYRQKIWNLGQPQPTYLTEDQAGAAAIAEMRGRLIAIENGQSSETLESVFQDMRNRFGFTGQRQELMAHMIADLYNLLPLGVAQVVGDIAKASKNPLLKTAAVLGKGGPTEVLKAYQQIIRQTPVDNLSKFEKWLGGVSTLPGGRAALDFIAEPNRPAVDVKNRRLWLNELTPQSKAYETTVMFRDNANALIDQAQSIEEVQKLLHLAANGKPSEVAQVWLNSAEGGVFPLMMREHVKLIDEFADNYRVSDAKRTVINNASDILKIEPGKLVDEIANTKGADDYINVLQSKLDDLARAGDTKAADLLRAINDPANPMTGAKLYSIASDFKRGNFPLTFDEWKYKLIDLLSEKIEKSAVDWFGVKPDRWLVRLGNTIKNAQSLVLLALNPSYLINNFITNKGTMALSGALSLDGAAERAKFIARMGIEPARFSAGIGAAEIGDTARVAEIGSAIRAATRPVKADTLTKLDDILRGTASKWGLATKYSAKVEGWSSEIAYYTGMRNAYRNLWKRSEGFSGMDGVLANSLREIGVEPDILYRAVEGSMNWKEVEENLSGGYKLESLDRALTPETKQMLSEMGLYDALADKLKNATTKADVVRALDDVKGQAFSSIQRKLAANKMARQMESFNRVTGEGVQAGVEIWDRNWMDHIDFWNAHHDKMGHVFEVANQLTGKNRGKYLAQEFARSDAEWRAQWEVFGSRTQGVIDALKESGDSVTTQRATDILINKQQNWQAFYDTRSKLYNLLNEVAYDKNQGALNELNRALDDMLGSEFAPYTDARMDLYGDYQNFIKTAMNRQYRDAIGIENGLQLELDTLFVDLFGRQFQNADAAASWRAGVLNIREQMAEANIYFRTGDASGLMFGEERMALKAQIDRITGGRSADSMSAQERHAAYRAYTEQIVKPLEARYMQENMVTSSAMAQVPPRDTPVSPGPMPQYPEMPADTVLTKVPGTLLRRYMDAEGYRDPRHMINAYNKYVQPEKKIARLDELTWGDTQKMTEARKEIKAAEVGASAPNVDLTKRQPWEMTKKEIKSWEFDVSDSGSKTPKDVFNWNKEEYETLYDLSNQDETFRFYESLGKGYREWKNSLNLVKKIKNDEPITVYRATSTSDSIVPGAYVSESLEYVKKHLENILGGEGKILSTEVKPSELMTYGDPHEFIYVPNLENYHRSVVERALSEGKSVPNDVLKDYPDLVRSTPGNPQSPEPDAVSLPLGEVEKYSPEPIDAATLEGWNTMVDPALRDLENRLLSEGMTQTGGFADQVRAGIKRMNPRLGDAEVNEAVNNVMRQVRAWLGTVKPQMNEVKLASLKWGQEVRDYSLLNYSRRTNWDTFVGTVFPYQFWYTRSMLNWARRAIDRPAIFANYARLKEFQQGTVEREGFPTRLAGKIGIRLPFLPDWMGDGVFIDPYRLIFPFAQFGRPITEMAEQNNLVYRKTISTLQDMAADEEITAAEAQAAIETGSGALWDKARARAKKDIDLEIANPFDAISMVYGPSLPIQYAYQLAMGRPERISQTPLTRGIQAVTGLFGIGGPAGFNPFGKIRKGMGLPEVDRFYDYRVDRMLASMTAMGEITTDQAKQAMIYREGSAFEEAQRKVARLGFFQYIGAPLGVDFFPEGEEDQRALRSEYDRAIEAWKNGDNQALGKFDDAFPEYEAQRLAWQSDPEAKLRMFLRSEVWDGWNKLSDLHKQQAKEQLGSIFTDAFLTKETRSYDSIDTGTYAMWARALGGDAGGVQAGQMQLRLAEKAVSDRVQKFRDEERKLFPEYYKIYDTPEEQRTQEQNDITDAHTRWKQNYIAKYPEIAQYVTSDLSNLYGLPPEIQAYVYQFRSARDTQFPGIFDTQEAYYAQPEGAKRRAFLKQHPELSEYWDMRTKWAADMPAASPYILSDESLRNRITGDSGTSSPVTYNKPAQNTATVTAQDLEGFDPALTRQLFGWAFAGQQLSKGAREELRRQWELAGQPGGSFEKYLAMVRNAVGR